MHLRNRLAVALVFLLTLSLLPVIAQSPAPGQTPSAPENQNPPPQQPPAGQPPAPAGQQPAPTDDEQRNVPPAPNQPGDTVNVPAHVARYGPTLGLFTLAGSFAYMHLAPLFMNFVTLKHVIKRCDGPMLQEIADLVDKGAIKPTIDKVLPLADVQEAHRYSESNRARGKIVLHVADG